MPMTNPGGASTAAIAALTDRVAVLQRALATTTAIQPGLRVAYRAAVLTGNANGQYPPYLKFSGSTIASMVVRNPVGSPGSVAIGPSSNGDANGNTMNNSSNGAYSRGTARQTIAAGEEYVETGWPEVDFVWSADATPPANLFVDVEIEYAAPGTSRPSPKANSKRALTTSTRKRTTIANTTDIASATPIFALSKDGLTYFRADPANGLRLQASNDLTTNPSSPTWANLYTFPSSSSTVLAGLLELEDGECLAFVNNIGFNSKVYRSSGWTANRATSTWAQVLAAGSGSGSKDFLDWYNAVPNMASGGVVILTENGGQTSGGAGNATADEANRAVHAYVSADNGATWPYTFNLRDYAAAQGVANPAGVHMHGCGYYAPDDTGWLCYGDSNGDGKAIAGANNNQVLFCHGLKAALVAGQAPVWQKQVNFTHWQKSDGTAGQYLHAITSDRGVLFTPDLTKPNDTTLFLPRTGWRSYDVAVPIVGTGYGNGMVGSAPTLTRGRWFLPSAGSDASATGTYPLSVMTSTDFTTWDQIIVPQTITATGTGASIGITRMFADAYGKALVQFAATPARMSGGNVRVGDLAYG